MAQLCNPLQPCFFPKGLVGAPRGRTLTLLCPESSHPTEARPNYGSHCCLLLGFSSSWKYIGASCVRPDRGIALGGSGLGFNCHFCGHMKMGLSSSKLWPDLGKPEGAHHQAQSCHKTFLGQPGLCCRFGGLESVEGFISGPWCTCHSSPATICHIHFVTTLQGTVSSSEPLASASPGGTQRCGCTLTPWGETLVCGGSLCHFFTVQETLCDSPGG